MSNLLEKASIVLTPTAYDDGRLHSIKPTQTLGSELVTNGDFATDSDWNKGDGWTIGGGTANCDGSQSATTNFSQSNVISDQSKTYRVEFTLSNYVAGSVKSKISNDAQGVNRSANGTYVDFLSGMSNNSLNFTATSDFIGSIDSVSVKEATGADFDFIRGTAATRVNSQGLIENVDTNLPRIDYSPYTSAGTCGHWLLESQSTNTATYSNDFTQGDLFNSSGNPGTTDSVLTSQQITAPDGTNNGWLLKDNSDGGIGYSQLQYFSTTVNSDDFNTISIFVKKALSNDFVILENAGFDADGSGRSFFNISNGSLANVSANHTAKIEDYGDGWYRCSITFQTTTDLQGAIYIRLASSSNTVNITRDGTNGVYIFGIQCEADDSRKFATSYIPTEGAIGIRNTDLATNGGNESLISSTEGVFYCEIAGFADGYVNRNIAISDGTTSNTVEIFLQASDGKIKFRLKDGGAANVQATIPANDQLAFNKCAFKYKRIDATTGDNSMWINGVRKQVDTDGFTFSQPLSQLNFTAGNLSNNIFEGKVKCVAVFKEALTDEELTCLTT